VHELDLRTGQVDVAGQQVHAGDIRLDHRVRGLHPALHQQVVDRQLQFVRLDAEPDRERPLRVEVHQ
jgi:hypothetical protein